MIQKRALQTDLSPELLTCPLIEHCAKQPLKLVDNNIDDENNNLEDRRKKICQAKNVRRLCSSWRYHNPWQYS